ncbi:MAG: efflux RND transporter periplasmic adaptor subunit [Candidatus Eisenbacteria bacterium]|nr:efflux RND transporter periplasmic adaptor subunit [Candidatus Eisenbacteria bacterium]
MRRTKGAGRSGAFPRGAAALIVLVVAAGCMGDEKPRPAGTFEAATVDVAPVQSGRTLLVAAEEGERIAAGDTLILLDTDLIGLRRTEAEAGRAGLRAQRAAGAAEIDQAERSLAHLETTRERAGKLRDAGTATDQRVDDLTAERDMARSRLAAARARVEAIDAEGKRLDAALAVFDRQIRDGVIVSPVSGTVLARALEPGEVAVAGRTALRVADLSEMELRIYLEAIDLDRVRVGDELPVLADALPGERLVGRVSWISDEAEFTPKNAQTRNARAQLVYAVKLRVPNPEGRLHVGMAAEVRIP